MRKSMLVILCLSALAPSIAYALVIPPWARKYNMNCSGCHAPVVPRLNATGLHFKWAGYRMPNEIGDTMVVKRLEEYVGTRGILRYSYAKTQGEPSETNSLGVPAVSVFAAGALGTNYGAYFELEREPEGTVDVIAQALRIWGKENGFGGVRAGIGHILVGGAVAGFDRPVGILTPLPLSERTTAAIPFSFAGDQAAIEAFYVAGGRNRSSVQLLNGVTAGEEGGPPSTKKDVAFTNQFVWDDDGSGITTIAYFGQVAGLDATLPITSRYYRIGASANKIMGPFEALAGYVYGSDSRLPVTETSSFTSSKAAGSGYWFSGQYAVPKSNWTFYGRYEYLDPQRSEADDALRRMVIGSVLPVNVPEYLRFAFEYFRDMPQLSGSPKRNGFGAEIMIAF